MSAAAVSAMVITGYQPLLKCMLYQEDAPALIRRAVSFMVCLSCVNSIDKVCEAAHGDVIRVQLSPADFVTAQRIADKIIDASLLATEAARCSQEFCETTAPDVGIFSQCARCGDRFCDPCLTQTLEGLMCQGCFDEAEGVKVKCGGCGQVKRAAMDFCEVRWPKCSECLGKAEEAHAAESEGVCGICSSRTINGRCGVCSAR